LEDFENFLNDKIEEYFETKNVDAIVNDITQKNCDKYNLQMINFAINKSLEMKENENLLITNFFGCIAQKTSRFTCSHDYWIQQSFGRIARFDN